MGDYFSARGYVVAIQDVRGRPPSGGRWEPAIHEGEDGYDTVEWLAAQAWSDGKVGTGGASYDGWIQFLTALGETNAIFVLGSGGRRCSFRYGRLPFGQGV